MKNHLHKVVDLNQDYASLYVYKKNSIQDYALEI